MNTKLFRLLVPVLVLVSLFVLVGTAVANPPPPTICGSGAAPFDGLGIKKTVKCDKAIDWLWNIVKTVDQHSLTLSPGQSHTVNYTVTATALANGTFHVYGPIEVKNLSSSDPVTLASVTDSLAAVACPVTFPYTLAPQETIQCWYDGVLTTQPSQNVVTVVRDTGATHNLIVPLDWSQAAGVETNECANITDTLGGSLGQACANGQSTFTFNYPYVVGPYSDCGAYTVDNTATVTPTEGGQAHEDSETVDVTVPCAGGCTLTPGYWKTHSSVGPAPYDNTWDAKNGGSAEFLDTGKSYYQVLWTSPSGGNAFYILAHAYIAAELNGLNGASTPANVQSAFNQATTLLTTYQYSLSIPKGADRDLAIALATILDNYNNGLIGPGHCSE